MDGWMVDGQIDDGFSLEVLGHQLQQPVFMEAPTARARVEMGVSVEPLSCLVGGRGRSERRG